MKELVLIILGVAIGYLAYPHLQPRPEPAPVAISEPSPTPVAAIAAATPRYENPLNRGAYNQRLGVASAPRVIGVSQTIIIQATPSPTPLEKRANGLRQGP